MVRRVVNQSSIIEKENQMLNFSEHTHTMLRHKKVPKEHFLRHIFMNHSDQSSQLLALVIQWLRPTIQSVLFSLYQLGPSAAVQVVQKTVIITTLPWNHALWFPIYRTVTS